MAITLAGGLAITATDALAVNEICDGLTATLCTVSTSKSLTIAAGGTLNSSVDRALRITPNGHITITNTTAGLVRTWNLTVTGLDNGFGFIMDDGASIVGDTALANGKGATINITVTNGVLMAGHFINGGALISSNQNQSSCSDATNGKGGDISLKSTNGNVTIENGATVRSYSKCPSGAINIDAPAGSIDIDGLVQSKSNMTGTGNAQNVPKGGGPVTVKASCELLITPGGVVSSRGLDPGADLVHLDACTINIKGLVESTGHGHAIPRTNFIKSNDCNSTHHAGKPDNATGCVEIWADSIEVNGPSGGEVHADIGGPGGTDGIGWVDLYARKNINIIGVVDPNGAANGCNSHVQDNGSGINQGCKVGIDALGLPLDHYAVHANGGTEQNTDDGGIVTIASKEGGASTSDQAVQASSTSSGGKGGKVSVETALGLSFGTASIQAKGATCCNAPAQAGGTILGRSYFGSVTGNLPGELNASGGPALGSVTLQACTAVSYTGTVLPSLTSPANMCAPTEPTLPAYVVLPAASCGGVCNPEPPDPDFCEKGPVKAVLNPITGRFINNAGPDVLVRLDLIGTPGNPASIQEALDTAVDMNLDGFIIVAVAKDATGQLGGSRTESIVINRPYDKRFALIGCSVTLNDANRGDGQPTGLIAGSASSPVGSPENIFIMDLHGSMSENAGWKVEGNKRYVRNTYGKQNGVGVWFVGNSNTMHNGKGESNAGDGIRVEGNSNLVDSSDVFDNGGNGVTVVGNTNTIKKVDAGDKNKGNGEDGANVNGNSNIISEIDAYSNSGYGIKVTGNSNQLLKNKVGDKGKSNGLDGINLAGNTNKVQENGAFANGGSGIRATGSANTFTKNTSGDRGDKANGGAGFLLSGGSSLVENEAIGNLGDGFQLLTSGFSLSKNVSGGTGSGYSNGGCQYRFGVAGNVNGGNNKSNNVTVTGNPFPAGCK